MKVKSLFWKHTLVSTRIFAFLVTFLLMDINPFEFRFVVISINHSDVYRDNRFLLVLVEKNKSKKLQATTSSSISKVIFSPTPS